MGLIYEKKTRDRKPRATAPLSSGYITNLKVACGNHVYHLQQYISALTRLMAAMHFGNKSELLHI